MKKIFLLMFFVLASISSAYAAHINRIELTDGSAVEGEIVSVSEGQYTVKSPSLGILKIEESKIRSMHSVDQAAAPSKKDIASLDAATIQSEAQKLQPAITGNPEIMKIIPGLIADPDFQTLFKDPEIVNAAKSLDVKTLLANEKFVKAMNNPTVREITAKVNAKDN